MSRYIDIENIKLKGISVFDQNLDVLIPLSDVRKSLQMTPTADVQEVRHGKWAHLGGDEWCCTCCGFVITTEGAWEEPAEKYCSYCGAKMDLEEKENG